MLFSHEHVLIRKTSPWTCSNAWIGCILSENVRATKSQAMRTVILLALAHVLSFGFRFPEPTPSCEGKR